MRASFESLGALARRVGRVFRNVRTPGFAYRRLAKVVAYLTRAGAPCPVWLASAMAILGLSTEHRRLAGDLRQVLATNATRSAQSIARTATRGPDLRAEKLVSHQFEFVWICNPKVASRSLIAALLNADPSAELFKELTVRELYAKQPRIRHYLSFAFVRHPYTRAHSFYGNKVLRKFNGKEASVIARHHGIDTNSSFDEVCAWLNTHYGSDAFADRHWLSQHRQIRLPTGTLPDFVGRYERLEGDLTRVAARLGMPQPALPLLNTNTGRHPDPKLQDREQRRRMRDLSLRNRALLQSRYATDFELFGYST